MKLSSAQTSIDNGEQQTKPQASSWQWPLVAAIVAAVFAAWYFFPVEAWVNTFTQVMKSLGFWGYLAFGAVYIIATVALAPGAILTLAAGLAYGGWGFPIVIVGATLGAGAAFLIGRYVARTRVQNVVEKRPKLQAVDRVVEEEGWKIVALLRLSPLVPFNLQNYFFGITNIKFWHYLLASFIGIMPGTALYIYLGALGHAAAGGSNSGHSALSWVLIGVGLMATVLVAVLVSRKAKAKLHAMGLENTAKQRDA